MEARGIVERLDRIRESGTRAAEIVSNMLSFARKGDAIVSSYEVSELLDKCIGLAASDYDLQKKYDFRQIEIVREYEDDLPLVPCDAGRIQQVLLNLLRNGAEAMQEQGAPPNAAEGREDQSLATSEGARFVLRVAYERDRAGVRIDVEDNGPGIAKGEREQLLLRGVRGDERVEGHGLGLAIVLEIVSAYHGDIDINQGDLGGARVSVTLKTR